MEFDHHCPWVRLCSRSQISPLLSTDGNTIAGELRYSGEDESFSDPLIGNSYCFLSWGLSRCFNALASIC